MNLCKPLPYTVALLLPEEAMRIASVYRKRLEGVCHKFEKNDTLHLTVKYLGYPSEVFPEKHVVELIPKICELMRPFIPAKVYIRGIDMFWKNPDVFPVAYLNVVSDEPLKTMHNLLLEKLGYMLEPFPGTDAENYRPHITISKNVIKNQVSRLKKLVFRSKKTKKRVLLLKNLVLFTPTSAYTILSVD
ncbi:MAG: 2'-5' RNA ligase family protein [Candidatus Riflebacteria bacterium]|nr:2'-5' RNA ligase family protein [Candidatus Riflebacteria bacterium]